MQRRTAAASSRPTGSSTPHGRSNPLQQPSSPSRAKRKTNAAHAAAWAITIVVLLVLVFSIAFPTEFKQVEQEAQVLGSSVLKAEQELAQKVVATEQQFVKDHGWNNDNNENDAGDNNNKAQNNNNNNLPSDWEERIAASKAVSKEREQQQPPNSSSRWVDGEKKLKQKLQVLYDRQNNQSKDLGVPVLTRWLGDDFDAYVTTGDMNVVEQWKKDVQQKYAEMRKEEEAWQKKMQLVINQRERDIGITTA